MGMVERRKRRLLPLLLVGSIAVGFTQAQNSPPTLSPSPTFSANPSKSNAPSRRPSNSISPSSRLSISDSPSLSKAPSLSSNPSLNPSSSSFPSNSEQPSHVPSQVPSTSTAPSKSKVPSEASSLSNVPSQAPSDSSLPSDRPSQSDSPSISNSPSTRPSTSDLPSQASMYPSSLPTRSGAPSTSSYPSTASENGSPSVSSAPSSMPTLSSAPSMSNQPSIKRYDDIPITEWKMLVANRFRQAFTAAETETEDPDPDTITIIQTNTTGIRVGQQTTKPILAMTGQATIVLNDFVDVSNCRRVQMLFWFYTRRTQANVESDRFVVEYAIQPTDNGDGTLAWTALETFQRGRGRFRRNARWYLGKAAVSTTDVQGVKFRIQSFYPSSEKMVLLDKFGILCYEEDNQAATSGMDTDEATQKRGVPNRSHSIQPIYGKTSDITLDELMASNDG